VLEAIAGVFPLVFPSGFPCLWKLTSIASQSDFVSACWVINKQVPVLVSVQEYADRPADHILLLQVHSIYSCLASRHGQHAGICPTSLLSRLPGYSLRRVASLHLVSREIVFLKKDVQDEGLKCVNVLHVYICECI
jgi:hypothetical protein